MIGDTYPHIDDKYNLELYVQYPTSETYILIETSPRHPLNLAFLCRAAKPTSAICKVFIQYFQIQYTRPGTPKWPS